MRVGFLNHDLKPSSGAGRFGLNLVERSLAADRELSAVVLTSLGGGHPREAAIIHKNVFKLLAAFPRIRAELARCDVVHALDSWPYGFIAALALAGTAIPLVITAIGTGAVKPLYGWRRPLLAWAYRRARRVIAISQNTRAEIRRVLPDLAVEVINHAVDADEFGGDPEAGLSETERSAIGRLKPYILSVGAWKRRKGFEYSFPAFAEMRKRFPDLGYVVCGIGPKPQLTEPLGVTGRVFYFKGVSRPFLRALYRNAELFILLPVDDEKDIEGFGFAFLEAAAAGIPVIGTLASGAEDAVEDGRNGFLVPPRNAEAAAEAAMKILRDPELRARFSRGSLDFARRMNWDRVVGGYRSLYRELATRNS